MTIVTIFNIALLATLPIYYLSSHAIISRYSLKVPIVIDTYQLALLLEVSIHIVTTYHPALLLEVVMPIVPTYHLALLLEVVTPIVPPSTSRYF